MINEIFSLIPFNTSPEVLLRISFSSCFLPHLFQLIPTFLLHPHTLLAVRSTNTFIWHFPSHYTPSYSTYLSCSPSCYLTCRKSLSSPLHTAMKYSGWGATVSCLLPAVAVGSVEVLTVRINTGYCAPYGGSKSTLGFPFVKNETSSGMAAIFLNINGKGF